MNMKMHALWILPLALVAWVLPVALDDETQDDSVQEIQVARSLDGCTPVLRPTGQPTLDIQYEFGPDTVTLTMDIPAIDLDIGTNSRTRLTPGGRDELVLDFSLQSVTGTLNGMTDVYPITHPHSGPANKASLEETYFGITLFIVHGLKSATLYISNAP